MIINYDYLRTYFLVVFFFNKPSQTSDNQYILLINDKPKYSRSKHIPTSTYVFYT